MKRFLTMIIAFLVLFIICYAVSCVDLYWGSVTLACCIGSIIYTNGKHGGDN